MHSVSHKFVLRGRANLINFPPSLCRKEPVGVPRANFFKFVVSGSRFGRVSAAAQMAGVTMT